MESKNDLFMLKHGDNIKEQTDRSYKLGALYFDLLGSSVLQDG